MCHFVSLGQVTAYFGRVRNPKHFVQSGNGYAAKFKSGRTLFNPPFVSGSRD